MLGGRSQIWDGGFGSLRHGYWMPKLRVVEARICKGSGGFGRGDQGFVPPGCGGFWVSDGRRFGVRSDQRVLQGFCRYFLGLVALMALLGFLALVTGFRPRPIFFASLLRCLA